MNSYQLAFVLYCLAVIGWACYLAYVVRDEPRDWFLMLVVVSFACGWPILLLCALLEARGVKYSRRTDLTVRRRVR